MAVASRRPRAAVRNDAGERASPIVVVFFFGGGGGERRAGAEMRPSRRTSPGFLGGPWGGCHLLIYFTHGGLLLLKDLQGHQWVCLFSRVFGLKKGHLKGNPHLFGASPSPFIPPPKQKK